MKRAKPATVDVRPYVKQFYKGNGWLFAVSILRILLNVFLSLGCAWLMQQLIDIAGGQDTGFSLTDVVVIAVVLLATGIIVYCMDAYSRPKFFTRGISQYKQFVFEELTKKNISAFSKESTSTYISALTNDIPMIEQGYLTDTLVFVENVLIFFATIIVMLLYSPLLTLVGFGLALLPLIASIITGNRMAVQEKQVSDRNEGYTSVIHDALSGFSVVKSFKAELQMLRIFKDSVGELSKAQCRKQKTSIFIEMFCSLAGMVAQLGVFMFGAYMAMSNRGVTAGTTIAFVQMMNYVLSPIGQIPKCIAERQAAKRLVEKIAVSLSENVRETKETEKRSLAHGIKIDNLSFGYTPEKQVLKDINYTFALGKKYAIVGASGSGKSTLLNLLMASYSHYDGSIYYDDTELKDIPAGQLYEIESIIQQSVFVFNATIFENVTMFREFSQEAVQEAVRLSGLSALIQEKGEGYLCGENGCGLSGGEKQRVSIARSLLKQSQVLLVDEATAALDAETAYHVASSILDLQGMTAIVVTHALDEALLKRYDGILTLKNGEIIESGTFEELIEKKGYFYSLFTISQ